MTLFLRHLIVFFLLMLTYGVFVGTSLLPGLINRWDLVIQVAIGTAVFYGNIYGIFPWLCKWMEWQSKWIWVATAIEWLIIVSASIAISLVSGALEIRIISIRGMVISVANVFAALFPLAICLVYSITYYTKEKLSADRQRLLSNLHELEKRFNGWQKRWVSANLPEHFLLNTLGMLREMSLSCSPHVREAYDLVLDILHYCLRKRNRGTVSVKRELKMVRKLIRTVNLKYKKPAQLCVMPHGKLKGARIVPMGILILVENIFAHGKFHDKSEGAELAVEFRSPYLFISTRNRPAHSDWNRSTGFGLTNLEQRLQHSFRDAFLLEHEQVDGWFRVSLVISMDGQLPESPPFSASGAMEIFS